MGIQAALAYLTFQLKTLESHNNHTYQAPDEENSLNIYPNNPWILKTSWTCVDFFKQNNCLVEVNIQ